MELPFHAAQQASLALHQAGAASSSAAAAWSTTMLAPSSGEKTQEVASGACASSDLPCGDRCHDKAGARRLRRLGPAEEGPAARHKVDRDQNEEEQPAEAHLQVRNGGDQGR